MKGKKFYFILSGLILVGIASIFLFRQQQEARILKFEGYEISEIEERVAGLYNKDKTDIIESISEEELEELDAIFTDLEDQEFGGRNERRLNETKSDLQIARDMHTVELEIEELFIEDGIIDQAIEIVEVDDLEQKVETFEDKSVYQKRNSDILNDARTQITTIETASEFVESLFDEETVREDVTREDEEEALSLIEAIQNKDVKEELTGRVEIVGLALTEMEEALALEEEHEMLEEEEELEEELLEEEIEFEEEETEYTAPANNWNSGSTGSNSSGSSGSNSNSGGSNWSPSPPSTPTPPIREPEEPETNPAPEPAPESEDDENNDSEVEDDSGSENESDSEEGIENENELEDSEPVEDENPDGEN